LPLPVAIHLAETEAELQLLADHFGSFRGFLEELGVWDPDGLAADCPEIMRYYAGSSHALFIHANYLQDPQAIPAGATVVYCPRTHAAFGHAVHPFRQFLEADIRVALGTDSLASNPDLSVLEEARFLHNQYPDFAGGDLLRMATLAGAEALGWQHETGSLDVGKSADLVVVTLPDQDVPDPHELLWGSSFAVQAVLSRGRWIYGPDVAEPAGAVP
jgi:cytosine/adenosine deaminase-related metal-dependent hydrolase